ncbi:MAG: aminotransferase class V-fold PLP-dependent enzyme [Woeseiaceae bacterium]|nr:aminotransferase class V-fold PLP-dependent enzyme [Woeseiaceae bacterium]
MTAESIYLDYAASTPVEPAVVERMTAVLADHYANPSSTHAAGREVNAVIDHAARQLAGLLNTDPAKLVWTSGATESDNLAIAGAARFRRNRGNRLVSMRTEHKAVTDVFAMLDKEGFDVTWLEPGDNGLVCLDALEAVLGEGVQLVSIMHVNNETGVIQDIAAIGELCRAHDTLFHVDAAQSVGKLPIDLEALSVDLMSMTAHKCYGPKGIGALYVDERPGCHLDPILFGGGQQRRLRPGTMPAPLIAGFGQAAEIAAQRMSDDLDHLAALRAQLWSGISSIRGVQANCDPEHAFPGILNVSVEDIDGESLLLALEPVCVASGSACNSQSQEPSYVLRGLGLSDELAQSAIRFSMGRPTTSEEIDAAIRLYTLAVTRLRQIAPGRAA